MPTNAEKLNENLAEIKNQTDALLAYANAQTGKDDTDLGEAIRSLVEGMGSGSGSGEKLELVASTTASLNLSSDTDFDSIIPSTNNQVIKSATYGHMDIILDEPIDTTEYDVIIVTKVAYEIVYKSNMFPRQKSGKGICFVEIHNTESFKYVFPNMATMYNVKVFDYREGLNTTNTTTFGVNKTASIPTIKTNNSPTNIGATNTHTKKYLTEVIFNSGQVTVRCNTSCTVESVSDIDSSATTFFDEALIYKKPKTSKDFITSLLDEIDL